MGKLSLKSYGWKCVLGAEVAYVLCLFGGLLLIRSARGMEIHRALFETMPGFTWLSFGSFILGAIYMLIFAWIFAWYYVWMHNSSIETK